MTPAQIATAEAIQRVELNNGEYYNNAYDFAVEWVKSQFRPFTSEDIKEAYYSLGNKPPTEPRVFGAVIRKLASESRIKRHGYEKSKNPTCHCRPQTVWISREYSLTQQKNRKNDYPTLFSLEN
jgi:hypothetical protein